MEDTFNLDDNLKNEYNIFLTKMDNIINELNIIELQFTKFYSQMPPLNINGFKKFIGAVIQIIF